MIEIKQNKQNNNDPDFAYKKNLGEKIENIIFLIHSKKIKSCSKDSLSKYVHIYYYYNFL